MENSKKTELVGKWGGSGLELSVFTY
jgi:hypothetical protein